MAGRLRGVAVSSTSVELCKRSLDRVAVTFTVGDTANASSVVIKDEDDATTTNGMPLAFGCGPLTFTGKAATHRFSAIRLAAVDCLVGVYEQFPDEFFANPSKPAESPSRDFEVDS